MNFKKSISLFLGVIFMGMLFPICYANNSTEALKPTFTTQQEKHYGVHYLMGHFNPKKMPGFVKIPRKYASRSGMYLREEALDAFIKMRAAARKEGVYLKIRSATRNFSHQKEIWEKKWLGKRQLSDGTNVARDIANPKQKALKILQYSSMPGTSRHHWGTDIDLNSFNNKWFEKGKGLALFQWMNANAAKYGFYRPYTVKNATRPYGYNEEKWHWSYAPLSAPMTQDAQRTLRDHHINGFLGSETAAQIGVVQHYILGVNESCR